MHLFRCVRNTDLEGQRNLLEETVSNFVSRNTSGYISKFKRNHIVLSQTYEEKERLKKEKTHRTKDGPLTL